MQGFFTYFAPLLILLFCQTGRTQSGDVPFRRYFTQSVQARLLQQDTQMAARQGDIELFVDQFNRTRQGQIQEVTIPVVFHILYQSPLEYLSLEQVLSQLDALNSDFAMEAQLIDHPANELEGFLGRAPDRLNINFCLAQRRIGSLLETGLNYLPSTRAVWTDDDAVKSSAGGGADPWDTQQYLNVWVAQLPDSISGYAQMPGGPAATDGIVIDYRFFGTTGTATAPYHLGHTLTHLIGNYLGLYDLWSDTPCGDDYVQDTPIHNAPNFGCPTYKHVTTCYDGEVEMTMNFMDNTNDSCLYLFTVGQMIRMHAILAPSGPRQALTRGNTACAGELPLEAGSAAPTMETAKVQSTPPVELRNRVSLAPNPTDGHFRLTISGDLPEEITLIAYNALGQTSYFAKYDAAAAAAGLQIDCSNWLPGSYFIHTTLHQQKFVNHLVVAR